MEEDYCDVCGEDLSGASSHYHCSNCGEVCSVMGHFNDDGTAHTCLRHIGVWSFDKKGRPHVAN